jgi:hypothetical protein
MINPRIVKINASTNTDSLADSYNTQRCEKHNLTIIYFKTNKIMDETQCWQCQREANKKKS